MTWKFILWWTLPVTFALDDDDGGFCYHVFILPDVICLRLTLARFHVCSFKLFSIIQSSVGFYCDQLCKSLSCAFVMFDTDETVVLKR